MRDVDFTIPEGSSLKVQRVTWIDTARNFFSQEWPFGAEIEKADPFKFTFKASHSLTDYGNPLSNVAYRVVLERQSDESALAKGLTASFVALLLLAGAGAGYDLKRRAKVPGPPPSPTLRDVCVALAAQYHSAWRGYTLNEADLLWCERGQIEEHIQELKAKGLMSARVGGITRLMYGFKLGAWVPGLTGLSGGFDFGKQVVLEVNPEKVGNPARLDALLDLMLREQQMSTFVGRPLEWDALNELARRIIPGSQIRGGESMVRAEDETIVDIASGHFNQVLDEGLKEMSFFHGTWAISRVNQRWAACQQVTLEGPLWIGDKGRRVKKLALEFHLPEKSLHTPSDSSTLVCWLIGKIVGRTYTEQAEGGVLSLISVRWPSLPTRRGRGGSRDRHAAPFRIRRSGSEHGAHLPGLRSAR